MRQQASTSTRWSTSSTPRACARLSSSPWHLRCDVSLQAERSPGAELSSHAFSLLYVCSVGSRCRSTWSAAASSTGRTPWRCTATCTAPRQHASATSSPLRARPRRACMYSRVYVLPHSFRTLQQPLGPVEHAESHEQISPESRLKVHRKSNESSQKVHRSPHRWFSEAASMSEKHRRTILESLSLIVMSPEMCSCSNFMSPTCNLCSVIHFPTQPNTNQIYLTPSAHTESEG
jgi:hypothetical protein